MPRAGVPQIFTHILFVSKMRRSAFGFGTAVIFEGLIARTDKLPYYET